MSATRAGAETAGAGAETAGAAGATGTDLDYEELADEQLADELADELDLFVADGPDGGGLFGMLRRRRQPDAAQADAGE